MKVNGKYKQLWETLEKIYGHRVLEPYTVCHKPKQEYPNTIYGLTVKGCMDYVEVEVFRK